MAADVTAMTTNIAVSGFQSQGFEIGCGFGLALAAVRRPVLARLPLQPELPPLQQPPFGGKTVKHYCLMEIPSGDFWVSLKGGRTGGDAIKDFWNLSDRKMSFSS